MAPIAAYRYASLCGHHNSPANGGGIDMHELHDLIAAGFSGLIDALTTAEETSDADFELYANHRVKGAMLQHPGWAGSQIGWAPFPAGQR